MATRLVRPSFLTSPALRAARRSCEVQLNPWWKQTSCSPLHANQVVCIERRVLAHVEHRHAKAVAAQTNVDDPETFARPQVLYASAGGLSALAIMNGILPSAALSAIPEILLPGSLADSSVCWVFEKFINYGHVSMGIQGIVSLGIFLNPLFEVMPRIYRERSVGKLPLMPYSAMAGQSVVWMFYGILINNPALYCPNFVGLVLGLAYWKVYLRYLPPGANWLPSKKEHHWRAFVAASVYCVVASLLLPAPTAALSLGLLGNLMVIAMFGGPLAAMRTVIKEQSTRCLPFWFTITVNLNCNMWFFYAYFILDDAFICLQDGIGLFFTGVQMALFARYGIYRPERPKAI